MKILNVTIHEGREGDYGRLAVTVDNNGIKQTFAVTSKYDLLEQAERAKKRELSPANKAVLNDLLGMVGQEI